MTGSNVVPIINQIVLIPSANDNRKYTKFILIDSLVDYIYTAIKDNVLYAYAESKPNSYFPVNFVEFVELYTHGVCDRMSDPHLIIDRSGEYIIMEIKNGITTH